MRLVSDNPNVDRDKKVEWARRSLNWSLRELAANLMRITRGAGKPAEVGRMLSAAIDSFEEYREAAGCYPSDWDISTCLCLDEPTEHWRDWDWAQLEMVKGGLQIAASQLVGQNTQMAAGRHEMFEGLAVIERIREANRLEATRGRTAPQRRRAKVVKRKPVN